MKILKAWTVWFTGLHCSGKSTISKKLAQVIRDENIPVVVLDGDELRKAISPDLGYTLGDRDIHMGRVSNICKIINENDILCIACVASPTEESRKYAKNILKNMIIVYTKCPVEVCEKRDVKGHYKKARNNEKGFENFVGISLPFEEPENADIVLHTDRESPEESVENLVDFLRKKRILQ